MILVALGYQQDGSGLKAKIFNKQDIRPGDVVVRGDIALPNVDDDTIPMYGSTFLLIRLLKQLVWYIISLQVTNSISSVLTKSLVILIAADITVSLLN